MVSTLALYRYNTTTSITYIHTYIQFFMNNATALLKLDNHKSGNDTENSKHYYR